MPFTPADGAMNTMLSGPGFLGSAARKSRRSVKTTGKRIHRTSARRRKGGRSRRKVMA